MQLRRNWSSETTNSPPSTSEATSKVYPSTHAIQTAQTLTPNSLRVSSPSSVEGLHARSQRRRLHGRRTRLGPLHRSPHSIRRAAWYGSAPEDTVFDPRQQNRPPERRVRGRAETPVEPLAHDGQRKGPLGWHQAD